MQESYGRDLDLNLLRVFVAVASAGSVTQAAAQLYLTQPAVSAALRRLAVSVGAPLFVRRGRGIALSPGGRRLYETTRPLLFALLHATLAPPVFDPTTSTSVLRLGLSDAMEGWLLPQLLRELARVAPLMRVVSVPVQFRTIADVLARGDVELAVTVADELPSTVKREPLLPRVGYVCIYDPRHVRLGRRMSEREYFAREHVIVSYNADLRGAIEDWLHKQRRVRCAVSSFSHVGSLITGSSLLATVPDVVAAYLRQLHPELSTAELPFDMPGGVGLELIWPLALDEDPAARFVRERLRAVAQQVQAALTATTRPRKRGR